MDGRLAETVDTYAPAAAAPVALFEANGLGADTLHSLRIVVRRDRHEASTGRHVEDTNRANRTLIVRLRRDTKPSPRGTAGRLVTP